VRSCTQTPRHRCATPTALAPEIPAQTHEPSDCARDQAANRPIWVRNVAVNIRQSIVAYGHADTDSNHAGR